MAMPRTYAAKRLLEHGPLTFAEFKEITGWPEGIAWSTLHSLFISGVAERFSERGAHRTFYRLVA